MGYQIEDLRYFRIIPGTYFLDANVWLFILNPKMRPSSKELKYIGFIEKLKNTPKVKIAISSMVISEVLNVYLHQVGMYTYAASQGVLKDQIDSSYYKMKYRKSEQYRIDYHNLCDDIKNFKNLTLIPDSFGEVFKLKHLLKTPPVTLDFNDFYFSNMAKLNNCLVVTDDGDFWLQDLTIITANKNLLNQQQFYLSSK